MGSRRIRRQNAMPTEEWRNVLREYHLAEANRGNRTNDSHPASDARPPSAPTNVPATPTVQTPPLTTQRRRASTGTRRQLSTRQSVSAPSATTSSSQPRGGLNYRSSALSADEWEAGVEGWRRLERELSENAASTRSSRSAPSSSASPNTTSRHTQHSRAAASRSSSSAATSTTRRPSRRGT